MDTKVNTNMNFCGSKEAARAAKKILKYPAISMSKEEMLKVANFSPAEAAKRILGLPTSCVTTETMRKALNYLA